jgi:WD40 repeat protein
MRKIQNALVLLLLAAPTVAQQPIAIDRIDRNTPVDFQTEILPILRANCLACHSASKPEGELVLESPQSINKGGANGPAVKPKDGAASLLLKVASHQEKEFMPPADNKVGARNLTSADLGLIKVWIDQGAAGSVSGPREVKFSPLPKSVAPIFATAVTGDGRFAACSRGNQIHVYHVASKTPVATLMDPEGSWAHADVVRSLAFDDAGTRLASGAFREVKLWQLPHVQRVAQQKFNAAITSIVLSPTSESAALGLANGQVRLIEVNSGKEIRVLAGPTDAITGLTFDPEGKSLWASSRDTFLYQWNADSGEAMAKFETPSPIQAVLAVHRGQWIVSAHEDGGIRVWDLAAKPAEGEAVKPLREIKHHDKPVTSLCAVPESEDDFICGGVDKTVRRFSASSGEQLKSWHHEEGPVTAVAINADGTRLATAGGNVVRLWDTAKGETVAQLKDDPRAAAEVARLEAQIAFAKAAIDYANNDIKSYEGPERRVMTTAEAIKKADTEEVAKAEKTLKEKQEALEKAKADSKDEKKLEQAQKELKDAETAKSVALTIVQRAKVVAERAVKEFEEAKAAVAKKDEHLKQLEAQKMAAQQSLEAARKPIRCLAFARNGQRLAVGREDRVLSHFDAAAGHVLETFEAPASAVAIAKDGIQITCGDDGSVQFDRIVDEWKLERIIGGTAQPNVFGDRVLTIDFHPDGTLLATGGGLASRSGELKIVSVTDGALVREIVNAHADTVLAVRFSPDGQQLASAGADRLVKVFQTADGQLARTFAGHTAHVLGVDWSADGKLLVSCGTEKALKLWDAATGNPIYTMKGNTYQIGPYRGEVTAASFIGNSEQILAASGDGTVRLHRASSENDMLTFKGPRAYIYSAAASNDGRVLVAGGADGILRVWSGRENDMQTSFPPPE